ncbi:gastrokine-1-like [Athene cunicularia]|uniref:gastrokine-1-like n=1 Tax=Athene cunicularia TaxID=194338 RepID=UPI000EF6DF65|nr:gastrokine-1-like [Athene cunicularia]
MKLTIVTTVLLGLLLTPALADDLQGGALSRKISITGGYQILTINKQWHVATIEEKSIHRSSKVILNYDMGFIGTKVMPEKTCFVSLMDKREIPSLDELPRLAEENNQLQIQQQAIKELTYVVKRPVRDLKSYGPDIFAMCRGIRTYVATEVHRPDFVGHQSSCVKVDVLQLFDLKYCHANIKS